MRRHIGVGGSLPAQQHHYVHPELPVGAPEWPLRFRESDAGADGGVREVELGPDTLILRRRTAGIPMRLVVRLAAFQGVAVALLDPDGDGEGVAVLLAHADPALCVTLYCAPHADDVVAQWRRWSAVLGLPMLMTHADGTREPAYAMLGRLTIATGKPRRRRRGALKCRRPSVYRRRSAGRPVAGQAVHRGEREMIARD